MQTNCEHFYSFLGPYINSCDEADYGGSGEGGSESEWGREEEGWKREGGERERWVGRGGKGERRGERREWEGSGREKERGEGGGGERCPPGLPAAAPARLLASFSRTPKTLLKNLVGFPTKSPLASKPSHARVWTHA